MFSIGVKSVFLSDKVCLAQQYFWIKDGLGDWQSQIVGDSC